MHDKKSCWFVMKAFLLCFLAVSPVFAGMSVPDGWYAEGNIGYSRVSNTSYNSTTGSSNVGGNVNVGYKFMPFFATEAGYTAYANTTIKNKFGGKAGYVRQYSYDLAGKGIIPIGGSGFELFAKLGAQRVSSNVSLTGNTEGAGIGGGSQNSNGLYLGVGGQYYFTPELALVGQWQRAQGNNQTGNLDLYSAGLSYIFG